MLSATTRWQSRLHYGRFGRQRPPTPCAPPSRRPSLRPCYFFYFSDFYRYAATIDGAIVSDEQEGTLCLNSFSPHYDDLKQSKLYQVFQDGIRDPVAEAAAGHAYIADWSGTRKDQKATLQRLKEKYNKPQLIDFQPKHYSGEMIVPDDKE